MGTTLFRCPNVGVHVQGWLSDDPSENHARVFETVTCAACQQVHLVNRAGRVLGPDEE
jgi:hypothetical protein